MRAHAIYADRPSVRYGREMKKGKNQDQFNAFFSPS